MKQRTGKGKILEEFLVHTKADGIREAESNVAHYMTDGITCLPEGMKGGIRSIIYDCSGQITRKLFTYEKFKDYLPLAGEIDFLLRNGERDSKVSFFDVLPDESYYIDIKTRGRMDFYFILTRERPNTEPNSTFKLKEVPYTKKRK